MSVRLASMAFFLSWLCFSSAIAEVDRREEGNLVIEEIPQIPDRIKERMFQYQNTRSAGLKDWDPSGKGMLIATRFAETYQLHWVGHPGGARTQITFFPEPVGGASLRPVPGADEFLFTMDEGGGEFYQIYRFDRRGGDYRLLTDGESRNGGAVWSNDGSRFAFFSTKRNGQDWDIYVSNLDHPNEPDLVLDHGGFWAIAEWSPDDSKLLLEKYVSVNESYLYQLDLSTKDLEQINPSEEQISYGSARWAKDGKAIYYTSDEGSEFRHLRRYDVSTGESVVLTEEIPWNVDAMEMSRDRDLLSFGVNEGGIDRLYFLHAENDEMERIENVPIGVIYGLRFNYDGSSLGLVLNTPQSPGDIYELKLSDRSLVRWTYSEVGGLRTGDFIVPELIHYETFDTVDGAPRKIPAFVYRPKDAPGPHPVLVYIHGGPEGQYVPSFSSLFQYFVNEMGLAVIAPNVRGSNGYGKTYLKLDNGRKREDSVRDIGKLLDWIGTQPDLDASRIGVMGGSYGGYMVLASMIHFSDRIKAGVESVGISNFVTFLENTQDYRRDLRREEYGDERDPEMRRFLEEISPANHAEKIEDSLLIAQGLNDPRVPVTESEQMVKAIRESGNPVWYVLARDEGHGFDKKSNSDFFRHAVVLFLEEHLLKP